MESGAAAEPTTLRRRRLLQLVFVFVNVVLVETHVPGTLWLIIGGIFWIVLVLISAAGSSLVCGTMCWIGAIQDFAEPLARPRIRIDPRWGRGLILGALLLWFPIARLVLPGAGMHDQTPLDVDPHTWPRHLFGLGLALAIPASVALLGKRGICRFLCPFNTIVGVVRRALSRITAPAPAAPAAKGCAGGVQRCGGCAHAAAHSITNRQAKGPHQ